ncbi:unnamed protein product [Brassicogethes aeneus]|uniref:Girdin n=1 Tax=Brassicogethes aeneus TaxID=1431903 RepID=A0A9P0FG08_BRAAE|nr:unnamed protein product [Brassicogethes aeneus]
MAASATEIEEFLTGPLVKWLSTCVKKPEALLVYETFFDGSPINEVLLQIDPEPSQPVPTTVNLQGLNITAARIKIFHCIIRNIKAVYEDELGQVVVALPDCVTLGRAPASIAALEQLKLLILLLLGCAVQGPTKEVFITRIKHLSVKAQHDIVECIKQVTDDQNIVLTLDWSEQPPQKLFFHVRTLTSERDKLLQQWVIDLGQENTLNANPHPLEGVESNHLAVELADWKARLRKQRQELEEKTEILAECKEELEHANSLVAKLKTENNDLLAEARRAKAYRDEVDAMRERAERADRLETEVQRYRERLADAEFYKIRVDELREDNRVLLETREMLETQLARARQRGDQVLELEAELLTSKQNLNEIALERDAAREKVQELIEENIQLQQVTKSALQETSTLNISVDSENEETNSGDNSLSEQLTNNAQARALKLELEIKKLTSTIDSLKEHNFHESSNKILDLEKEKKKLLLKCEQLQEGCERLTQQNGELENLFKNAIQENRKLQDSVDTNKIISDRQNQDLQNEKTKINDLEKNIETLSKEKQRIHTLCDSIRKRADDAEKSVTQVSEQLHSLQVQADKGQEYEKLSKELKDKISALEKENGGMQKEVSKLKELVEVKDVTLDKEIEKNNKYEKDLLKLTKENQNIITQLEKLQEFEQKAQELLSQFSIHTETISTLQKDLVNEKVNNEKFKKNLEKLGLSLDILDNDLNIIVEKMLNNPDLSKILTSIVKEREGEKEMCKKCTEKISKSDVLKTEEIVASIKAEWSDQCDKLSADIVNLQNVNGVLQNENAKMQVDISTYKSQINSLQAQQTALQLANSQLVAEKDELSKKQEIQNHQHDTLLFDQVTLRTIHEQLNTEYEDLKKEQESLRKMNRDLRSEIRTLREKNDEHENKVLSLEIENESIKSDAQSLNNLRAEHSKLKDDFRNLFTASERLKVEYRAVQDELKNVRTESRTLRLGQTEMQGELNTRSDLVSGLQLENAKLQQKCDMLFEMNHSLDSDRRVLMDHVSQLLSQYHSLLTHSLEDKQHYHLEEKLFTDKVNNLCRQKEKLEEKIMEHYRKLDNASSKKKSFGATLVRRVRKAGSDIINKVPSRNRRSWHEDTARLTQSQFTLGGGSGESAGNDSDNSAEESGHRSEPFKRNIGGSLYSHKPRDEVSLRRSHRDLSHRNSVAGDQVFNREPGSALSLGSVGSRRTVYLSEEDTTPIAPPPANNQGVLNNPPPMLVYNRISTVIGEVPKTSSPQSKIPEETIKETPEPKKPENPKETAVWYEYGCV